MINILHLIESSETGGAEKMFKNIIYNIDKSKYFSYAGLLYKGWLYDELYKDKITPFLFSTNGSFDIKLIKRLVVFIKRYDINIIHSHLFGMNVYASIAGKICNIPVISTFHGQVDVKMTDRLIKFKFKIINCFSQKVIYVSNSLYNYFMMQKLTNSSKSVVIYNGIDILKYSNSICLRKDFNFREDDIIVGCIGDVRPIKGYNVLLESARALSTKYNKLKYLIVGYQTKIGPNLNIQIRDYGLCDVIKFVGYRDDIYNILNTIDIYVLPSISEGFSLSTIEAMAAGKPVIATKCGGPEEIITNSHDGILVNVNDPDAISRSIELMMKDREKRYVLGQNAQKTVLDRFSMEKMIMKYMNLYEEVLLQYN